MANNYGWSQYHSHSIIIVSRDYFAVLKMKLSLIIKFFFFLYKKKTYDCKVKYSQRIQERKLGTIFSSEYVASFRLNIMLSPVFPQKKSKHF